MLRGSKEFVLKGNVRDLAVAVIIGAAFAQVVNAMVEAVLMPAISAVVGSPDSDSFAVVTLNGNDNRFGVLTALVDFLLVAAAVYVAVVLPMHQVLEARTRRLGIDPAAEEADPQVQLLTGIRDALRERT